MLFPSGFFLFGFLPTVVLAYFGAPRGARNGVLLIASLLFYAWTEPLFICWALVSALVDYALGARIARSSSTELRQALVAVGVGANLGLLGWCKYAGFAVRTASDVAGWFGGGPFHLADIALPVAVSFIVFEKITYLVDLYRGTGRPAPHLARYLLYVFFFPKLLAGPIIRYCDIEKQLGSRPAAFADVRDGLIRFIYGLGKKVLIADSVAGFSDKVFALPSGQLGGGAAWLGVLCFTVQIYYDFAGYSDMALGLARVFGFHLRENFHRPYLAASLTEFWQRWHISLTTWIREYLYIPLGGSRGGARRTYFNLCLCFFLSGLWHGAAWPYLAWGLFHGMILLSERLFWLEWKRRLPPAVNLGTTWLLVMVSWVIFRTSALADAGFMLRAMFTPWRESPPSLLWFSPDILSALLLGLILVFLPLTPRWAAWAEHYRHLRHRSAAELAASLGLLVCVVGKVATDSFSVFLYFRF